MLLSGRDDILEILLTGLRHDERVPVEQDQPGVGSQNEEEIEEWVLSKSKSVDVYGDLYLDPFHRTNRER